MARQQGDSFRSHLVGRHFDGVQKSRVQLDGKVFIINCIAKWCRLYDKNHYNKFSACLIVKQEKSSIPFFPISLVGFPSLLTFQQQQQLIMAFILVHCQNQTLRFARLAAN